MNNLFYNTANESGSALKACKRAVNRQEKKILAEFKAWHPHSMAPSAIHKIMPEYPITSIRRAITNLTDAGYLRKTPTKILSPWGRREHCWEIMK